MPTYKYLGMSKDSQKLTRDRMEKDLEPRYWTNLDGVVITLPPLAMQTGRQLMKRGVSAESHMAEKRADIDDTIAAQDGCLMLQGIRFEKGKPVTLPSNHPLLKVKKKSGMSKMGGLVDSGTMAECAAGPSAVAAPKDEPKPKAAKAKTRRAS